MPNREFLEESPLYRKFKMELPQEARDLEAPAIHMHCPICGSGQTFNNALGGYSLRSDEPPRGVVRVVYRCTSCGEFERFFMLKFDPEENYVMKVGQEPPWEITPDCVLESALGSRAGYYKKGLICESQSYGIGAFAYYRRVVEEIIDELLADIADLIEGEEKEKYLAALEQAKKTKVTQDKIALVKDLLPPILRPQDMNPLSILHVVLSEGLHQETDERCIELAMEVRQVLEFLVNQIAVTQTAAATFTDSMRRLLDRRQIRTPDITDAPT